jgi:hypothetical protein
MTNTAAATVRVEAFHNLDTTADDYEPGHRVTRVFATDEPAADPDTPCKEVHRLLTVGAAPCDRWPDPRAANYRARGNRGLGLGDIIAITGPTGTTHYALNLAYTPVSPPYRTDEPFYATIPLGDDSPVPAAPRPRVRVRISAAMRILAYCTVGARYRWMFDPVRSGAAAYWVERGAAARAEMVRDRVR